MLQEANPLHTQIHKRFPAQSLSKHTFLSPMDQGSILFSVVGRTHFGFDVFCVDKLPSSKNTCTDWKSWDFTETQLTDGISVNFNGSFAKGNDDEEEEQLVYVSERTGSAQIYINSAQSRAPLLGPLWRGGECNGGDGEEISGLFFDRPSMHEGNVFSVATEKAHHPSLRQSWTTVCRNSVETGKTVRLSPPNVADFSPSVSPSGKYIAVASYQDKGGWQGDIEDLHTDIFVFNAEDGSDRRLVARNGGWPTWANDDTIFFHRRSEDGWWSIYRTCLNASDETLTGKRITPPCVHAFTPAASTTGNWLAVCTRRMNTKWRHVEIFDLDSKEFIKVTAQLNPEKHHFNPFVADKSGRLGYHRGRDIVVDALDDANKQSAISPNKVPLLEAMQCPVKGLPLVRVDGSFPAASPCGQFIAYNKALPGGQSIGLFIMRSDGSKEWHVSNENLFYCNWDPVREGVIYCSAGPIFAQASVGVQVVALHVSLDALADDVYVAGSKMQPLTLPHTANNAFPAPSPDGKWVVFRSGRGGPKSKNLYIMDAEQGEEKYIRRLTCGDWFDTMPSWSPDGQWIAFSSNRDGIDEGSFGLYMIRPDGSGLHRVFPGGDSSKTPGPVQGRVNHVDFSPDSRYLVFTADLGGVTGEPISLPNQFQPYGELFISKIDGSNLVRLTHNAYEDGTPTWTAAKINLPCHKLSDGTEFIASNGSSQLCADFFEPLWLERISEEMKRVCC